MDTPHPNDKIAALEWAIRQAEADNPQDAMAKLIYLPALKSMRDDAIRESRG
jgi:hypothetical protein